jgi:uncharacterized membrane protein YraQ (UPF0718 family)
MSPCNKAASTRRRMTTKNLLPLGSTVSISGQCWVFECEVDRYLYVNKRVFMSQFLTNWKTASTTTLGLFWMAFWAFGLGYLISSLIQVFITRERMRQTMGKTGPKSVFLAMLFGFVSSSCSFAALSTTRALFAKGAGLVPSLAFLLASTNLVIELGIVIAVF